MPARSIVMKGVATSTATAVRPDAYMHDTRNNYAKRTDRIRNNYEGKRPEHKSNTKYSEAYMVEFAKADQKVRAISPMKRDPPKVGGDSLMNDFAKNAPPRTGVQNNFGYKPDEDIPKPKPEQSSENYMMAHVKAAPRRALGDGARHGYGSGAGTMPADNFIAAHVAKSPQNPLAVQNRFAYSDHGTMDGDSYMVNQVRSTPKRQTERAAHAYTAEPPKVSIDSFEVAFAKQQTAANPNKYFGPEHMVPHETKRETNFDLKQLPEATEEE